MRSTLHLVLAAGVLFVGVVAAGCRSRAAPEAIPGAEHAGPRAAAATPLAAAPTTSPTPPAAPTVTGAWATPGKAPPGVLRFAAIGDFGVVGDAEQAVSELVIREQPELVITLGDNNYPIGSADTIDVNIGRFYSSFISPYKGSFGKGSKENRFFPSLGNHDWMTDGARPYLDYFTLPGNERYYELERGDVHLFSIDSDPHEPDGIDKTSVQARWLKEKAGSSKKAFQIAYMHHPPFSSARHGSSDVMQWPYEEWGVDLVLAGHDHTYERIVVNGLTYVVNGLGGNAVYSFGDIVPGSKIRFNRAHGAMFFEVSGKELHGRFLTSKGEVIDAFTIAR